MRNTKRRVGSLVLKIETNGLQILVQREILHKYSCIRAFFFSIWFIPYLCGSENRISTAVLYDVTFIVSIKNELDNRIHD